MIDTARLARIGRELLEAIGENPDREGLRGTPDRFARWWAEFIDYDPGRMDTTFTQDHTGQMVIVSGLRIWSLCEHHLLPFWADVSVAYIPSGRVMGLSKVARIAHHVAHRLQLQEQLVAQIADQLETVSSSSDVAVLASGVHLCMTMRGVRTPGTMTSLDARGRFRDEPALRGEFLQLARG
jgi:GTP cyclohydrolase IA